MLTGQSKSAVTGLKKMGKAANEKAEQPGTQSGFNAPLLFMSGFADVETVENIADQLYDNVWSGDKGRQ